MKDMEQLKGAADPYWFNAAIEEIKDIYKTANTDAEILPMAVPMDKWI